MRPVHRAADAAKSLLSSASRRLLTPDPVRIPDVRHALEQSLDWPIERGERAGQHERSFEPTFSETNAASLAFNVRPGGSAASDDDRRAISTGVARHLVGHQFGPGALHWLDGKIEAQRDRRPAGGGDGTGRGFGAAFSAGLDRGGLNEVAVSYEWGGEDPEMLPPTVLEMARRAMTLVPGLRPFYMSVRCGPRAGGHQIGFDLGRALDLNELKPLMDAYGLGHRHAGLLSLTGFILGARFSLPPESAVITLMNTPRGPELRLDVNLDALPDTPEQLLPLLRLPMTERPRNLAALDRWVTALTPDGYYGPGSVSVLSVRVRQDMPARVALYLAPIALDVTGVRESERADGIGVGHASAPIPAQASLGALRATPAFRA